MAIVQRRSLTNSASAWDSFFNSLNCSLISSSGGIVSIGTEFSLRLNNAAAYFYKGSTSLVGSNYNWPIVFTVCCSDNLVSIQLKDPQSRRIVLIYETFDNFDIYATAGGGNNPYTDFYSINNLTFTDTVSGLTYKHTPILNFNTQPSYINYTPDALFQTNGIKESLDPNFISCTNIVADNIITFGGQNYYSIGTNTLVRINIV